jgi:hypothetical protein
MSTTFEDFFWANPFFAGSMLAICLVKLYPLPAVSFCQMDRCHVRRFAWPVRLRMVESNEFVTAATSLLWFNTFW